MKNFRFPAGAYMVTFAVVISFTIGCGDRITIDDISTSADVSGRSSGAYDGMTVLSLWMDVTQKQIAYNANPSSGLATEIADLLSDIEAEEMASDVLTMWSTRECGYPCLADYSLPVGSRTLTCEISLSSLPKLGFIDDQDLDNVSLHVVVGGKEEQVAELDTSSRTWYAQETLATYEFQVDTTVFFTDTVAGKLKYDRVNGSDLEINVDIYN